MGTPSADEMPPGALRVPLEADKIPVNFTEDQYLANVTSALKRKLPVIATFAPPHDRRLLICGNGPSLAMSANRLRKLARKGHKVVACNNSYAFLKRAGVPVWAQAVMDASENTIKYVSHRDELLYLVCSLCDPRLFDTLEGRDILLWHVTHHDDAVTQRALDMATELKQPAYFFGGGSTIALRMPWIGYALGFRKFELYGVDSSFMGARQYAAPAHVYGNVIKVFCGDREFLTSPQMADQAASFMTILKSFHRLFPGTTLDVHGQGLIPEIVRQMALHERRENADR